jgi:hypothetical protein
MAILSIFLVGFVAAFPILLVLGSWRLVRRRLPWIGMLVSIAAVLLFWLFAVYGVILGPGSCPTPGSCDYIGLDIFMATAYCVIVWLVSLVADILFWVYYHKRVWAKDAKALKTGKVPFFILLILVLFVAGYFAVATSVAFFR